MLVPVPLQPSNSGGPSQVVAITNTPIKWVGLITQASTSAPTAKVLQNQFGVDLVLGYTSTGIYTLTAPSAIFTANKTLAKITPLSDPANFATIVVISTSVLTITTKYATVVTNALLTDFPVEITIFS